MKILIAMPSGDLVHKGFCISYGNLLYHGFASGIHMVPGDIRTTGIERGRNMAVRDALRIEATHILWLDSDMKFPGSALSTLLSHDKEIVGATYRMRREPFAAAHRELAPPESTPLRRVARLPSGMILVRTEVYDRLDLPWYRNPFVPGTEEIITQDFDFCDRARALGFDVWMDVALSKELRHLGEYEYAL